MPMRMCNKCSQAENPLGRLRFKKSRVDGKVYCENCGPMEHSLDLPGDAEVLPPRPALSSPSLRPSAGYVVVDCPDCAGGVHRPRVKPCKGCAGYGAVRIDVAALNVYRPSPIKTPEVLTEG